MIKETRALKGRINSAQGSEQSERHLGYNKTGNDRILACVFVRRKQKPWQNTAKSIFSKPWIWV